MYFSPFLFLLLVVVDIVVVADIVVVIPVGTVVLVGYGNNGFGVWFRMGYLGFA